jgi:hypothetical protein
LCSTVTATLRISRPSSGGSPSSAAATISSKRPGSTSITSPLCATFLVPQALLDDLAGIDDLFAKAPPPATTATTTAC